ncbi:disease resistance-like protein DSC1 [Mercurialis annua]|uniref:disease resistance-like protein DSC1 n=1 Tax=Mercurialis annua TaxID=3986 RepID=UPI0021600573|nr:disease resistance-like protein DSC1 [Mercurialis annua]XP_050233881.1 disease resistance-like protein DSC1 [Mercurialis annua]XP_050233891.1 disease resistance-like protein DSC1 [Mercurialis annua]
MDLVVHSLVMMASSSTCQFNYDVFVSFRGEDTRNNFVSHLYAALHQKQIRTFVDDRLARGEDLSPALSKVIEGSLISIIIFSENYAFSPWCLDELVKILDCKMNLEQAVLPVFYRVNPSDVAEQKGSFGAAFVEHAKFLEDKLQNWKAALTEAANISGWSSYAIRSESKLIQEIVEDVLKKLNNMSLSSDSKGLVGIDPHIDKIESLLCAGLTDVRFLGIWGMGGAGKTTIAEVVFTRLSSKFDGCCFLTNVNEESERYGLLRLQEQLFSKLMEQENVNICSNHTRATFDKFRLRRRKVLIVLDDVNNLRQLVPLAGEHNWYGPGSRIIITSRDRDVLKDKVDVTYKMEELDHHEALQLFSLYAFKQDFPEKDFMKLSKQFVNYAKGNPLGLRVLGSFLHQRNIMEWESALRKLEKNVSQEIQNVLKVSYDGLDDEEKGVFLDIACFFNGDNRDAVARILNGSFSADIALSVLVSRSLLTISNNKLHVHNLLQQMGWEIVRQESVKEPGRRTRLWTSEDVHHVLTKNTGTEAIEGIYLDMSKSRKIFPSSKALERMHNLRLLKFYHSFSPIAMCSKVYLTEGLASLPDKLTCLHWNGYPLKSLPFNFNAEYLVELSLPYSRVEFLWEASQCLQKLSSIDLSHSCQLIRLPEFSKALNLECINLEGCVSLVELPSSIERLTKLNVLNLKGCKELKRIPSCLSLQALRKLNLSACSGLNHCPQIPSNVEDLNLDGTGIEELPASIEDLHVLTFWSMDTCKRLKNLPRDIYKLVSLKYLSLAGCLMLDNIPIGIKQLSQLQKLNISGCEALKRLPELPLNLRFLNANSCISLETVSLPSTVSPEALRYHNSQIFCFTNCQKLDQNSYSLLAADAQKTIQYTATAAVKNNYQEIHSLPSVNFCFPGTKIPNWLGYRDDGSSITVKLHPDWHKCPAEFLGFAVGCVVEFTHYVDINNIYVICECNFRTSQDDHLVVNCFLKGLNNGNDDLNFVRSHHVYIGYDFGSYLRAVKGTYPESLYHYKEVTFKFYAKKALGHTVAWRKVDKCGVHLLYAQDNMC